MESAWRQSATGTWPEWMADWMIPFAWTIDGAKKYVVSGTLDRVDWKRGSSCRVTWGKPLSRSRGSLAGACWVGGVTLPLALADLGLIDEYEFVVWPVVAGHGPTLFAGLGERIELKLVERQELRSGAVALRYQPSRVTA